MDYQEANQHADELIDALRKDKRSAMESTLQALGFLGLSPFETVELRVSAGKSCDFNDLAQRAAKAMLVGLRLRPTSIAVHPALAALFEASEAIFKIDLKNNAFGDILEAVYDREYLERPIHIEVDNSFDTRTVAARFKMDTENNEEFDKAMIAMIMKVVKKRK